MSSSSASRRAGRSSSSRHKASSPCPSADLNSEKEMLHDLNDRLANYVDNEDDPERRLYITEIVEDCINKWISALRARYEKSRADDRKKQEELQIELTKGKTDYDSLLAEFNRRDRGAAALETEVVELRTKLTKMEESRRRLERENSGLLSEAGRLKKEVEEKSQAVVELEGRVKALEEDLETARGLQDTLDTSFRRIVSEVEELEAAPRMDKLQLKEHLDEMRRQAEVTQAEMRLKFKALVQEKDQQLKALDVQLRREREDHRHGLGEKEAQYLQVSQAKSQLEQDYQELWDTKSSLEREINTYKILIDYLEGRRAPPSSAGSSRKRARLDELREELDNAAFTVSETAKGGMAISAVDPAGRFIKLKNNSTRDIALGSWQLQHTAGDVETTFRFHHTLVVKAGKTVTVWSSDSDRTHHPPIDIVMRDGKRWFVSDHNTKTALFNRDGQEVASLNKYMRSTRTRQLPIRRAVSEEPSDERLMNCHEDRVEEWLG